MMTLMLVLVRSRRCAEFQRASAEGEATARSTLPK